MVKLPPWAEIATHKSWFHPKLWGKQIRSRQLGYLGNVVKFWDIVDCMLLKTFRGRNFFTNDGIFIILLAAEKQAVETHSLENKHH